ncbi:M48 family metallopeptidase [Dokdonia ponticola]|uniref:M48 family metallopeptidase n=1 Tax=Dokdonia ponticola TaxID=2041041 RepID=A0ABV9I2V6_9FLAO
MKDQIKYGNTLINYQLDFVERKSLAIKVHPDKSVNVIAPKGSSIQKVREKVRKKAPWIVRQQDFFLSFHPLTPARKFISGETHLYLGKQYRLKLHTDLQSSVKLAGGFINVYIDNIEDKARIEKLLNNWYREKATYHFEQLFKENLAFAKSLHNEEPKLSLRWMKKRWGSCSKDGKILLNLELIKAPKKCIEYVIVHEICHLKYLNHSNSFYNLLNNTYPDWKATKDRLERIMV